MLNKLTDRFPDHVIRLAGWSFFFIWLVSWAYSASKMMAFKDIGFRPISLPLEIITLILWAACFYVKSSRSLADDSSPMVAVLDQKDPNALKSMAAMRRGASAIPLGFALLLGAMYLLMIPMGSSEHPSWPSPAMPAEICFAPMVFFFGGSSFGMRRFQNKLVAQAQAAQADDSAPA